MDSRLLCLRLGVVDSTPRHVATGSTCLYLWLKQCTPASCTPSVQLKLCAGNLIDRAAVQLYAAEALSPALAWSHLQAAREQRSGH